MPILAEEPSSKALRKKGVKGMKRFFFIIYLVVFGLILTMSNAQAEGEMIETDESMYNLDPYYWVYSASQYSNAFGVGVGDLWPTEGHPVTVGFSLTGVPAGDTLSFSVDGLEGDTVTGPMTDENGVYKGSFIVDETSVGGVLFKGGALDADGVPLVPRGLTLTISNSAGAVADRQIQISRWGCDRCHVAENIARELYDWSAPMGSDPGPHNWPNILGRNGGRPGFTYDNLTYDRLTHTPTIGGYVSGAWVPNPLDYNVHPEGHQKTLAKFGGDNRCSPCHQGRGHVRYDWFTADEPLLVRMNHSLEVKCSFCHNINSGYVPRDVNNPLWENNLLRGWN